jgi:hypothetical protein
LNIDLNAPFNGTVDHAPVVTQMKPDPSVGKIPANLGANCAPAATFFAESVDDADGDDLTVRWTLEFPEEGFGAGSFQTVSRVITEFTLQKLPVAVDNKNYDFPPFELDQQTLVPQTMTTDELAKQVSNFSDVGQLLELFISDGGFEAGTNDASKGFSVVSFSWAIQLQDTPCGP